MKITYKKPGMIVVPLPRPKSMLLQATPIGEDDPDLPPAVREHNSHRGGWDWDDNWEE